MGRAEPLADIGLPKTDTDPISHQHNTDTHTATPISAIYHTPDSREHESRTPSNDTLAYHTPNTHRVCHTPSQTRDSSKYSTPLHLSSATRIARHTPPTTNQTLKTHQHQHRAGDTKRQTANRGTAPMMIISSQRSSMIGPQISRALRIYERSEKSSGHLRWLLGRKSIVRSQRSSHLGG